MLRAAALLMAPLLLVALSGCSDDPNSIAAQAKSGNRQGYISGDGNIETIAVGIYDSTRGAEEPTGGGAIHRQATVDVSLSIRDEHIQRVQLRKGDRVYFPDRKEMYDVTFIHPDPGGRPDVHLVRVLEDVAEINP